MDPAAAYTGPQGVQAIFQDFKGRRAAVINALTTDYDEFFMKCDPEKDNLCLYGFPDKTWNVNLPAEEVPTEIPEPMLGINFVRDGMPKKDWLSFVARHSDSWLISLAFYYGSEISLNKSDRRSLFSMINDLPTIYETVIGTTNSGESISCSKEEERAEKEAEEEEEDTTCGMCKKYYSRDEFWICCDVCETWYHGKCVKITEARAEYIKQYKCPSCYSRRRK